MSESVTTGGEAWVKLNSLIDTDFYLTAAESALILADVGAIAADATENDAGPDSLVSIDITGPAKWDGGEVLELVLSLTAATGTVVPTLSTDDNSVDEVTIDTGGSVHLVAPDVTFKASAQTAAEGTAVLDADGYVESITITEVGSYLDSELPITVTIDAPTRTDEVTAVAGESTSDVALRLAHQIEAEGVLSVTTGTGDTAVIVTVSIEANNGEDLTIDSVSVA
jgi:hypothetical protein